MIFLKLYWGTMKEFKHKKVIFLVPIMPIFLNLCLNSSLVINGLISLGPFCKTHFDGRNITGLVVSSDSSNGSMMSRLSGDS